MCQYSIEHHTITSSPVLMSKCKKYIAAVNVTPRSHPIVVVLTTSELFIREKNSAVTSVIKPIDPVVLVIPTSDLFIMVRDSAVVTFVNPSSHKAETVITTEFITFFKNIAVRSPEIMLKCRR